MNMFLAACLAFMVCSKDNMTFVKIVIVTLIVLIIIGAVVGFIMIKNSSR